MVSRITGSEPAKSAPANLVGLDALSTAVLMLDAADLIIAVNSAAEDLFGFSRRQLLGTALQQWLPADAELWTLLRCARAEQRRVQLSDLALLLPLSAPHWLHVVVTPEGERLLLECLPADEAHRLHDASERARRAAGLLTVLRNLAHEIKNPLAGLRGGAQLLAQELKEMTVATPLLEYTDLIQREADRLRALVERLLLPTRSSRALHKTPVNIHVVLDEVQTLLAVQAPDIEWQRDYDPSLPELPSVRDGLHQILLNLMQNAVEAITQSQTPLVQKKIQLKTRAQTGITIGKRRARLSLRIDIIDSGPGIADSIREQLFVPLTTTKAQGTGLGLALVQSLVEQQGGAVLCESSPGATSFTLYFSLDEP